MDHLRAGAALFNAGEYLAAHEPWEERWLEAPPEERDDCLQGLIQATAAVHKARAGIWSGAVGLAGSATTYLDGCDHGELRAWVARLVDDPELAERERPPPVVVDGDPVTPADLAFPAAARATAGLAETRGHETVERAVEYAEADLEAGEETSPFVGLVRAYLLEDSTTVRQRIADHVGRRENREGDVEGLFDAG